MNSRKIFILKITAIVVSIILLVASALLMARVFHRHSYSETVIQPTCQKEGYTVHYCDCGESYTDAVVQKTEHEIIDLEAVEPKCFLPGLTAGKKCKNCSLVVTAQTEIPALNVKHHMVDGVCTTCGTEELVDFISGAKVLNNEEEYKYWEQRICSVEVARSNIIYKAVSKDIIVPRVIYNKNEQTNYAIISLAEGLFKGYRLTQAITIQDNVLIIGAKAFRGCVSLERISVDESNPNFCDENYVLYNKDKTTLVACPAQKKQIVLDKSVKTILDSAFSDCLNLSRVFYGGTANDRENIEIQKDNIALSNATWYYYAETKPSAEGKYWRYVNGVPTAW